MRANETTTTRKSLTLTALGAALAFALAPASAHAATAPAQAVAQEQGVQGSADTDRPLLGSFGIGVRLGSNQLSLSAARVARAFGGQRGESVANDPNVPKFDLNASMFQIVPTFHFGGSGYFFKMELPIGRSADLDTWGVGLYPVNVGIAIPALRIMPTLSVGAVGSYARSRSTDSSGAYYQATGVLIETKVGVGVKFFPVHGVALSLDIARTPWAVGAVLDAKAAKAAEAQVILTGDVGDASKTARGGIGSGWEISLGVHWL